MEAKLAVSTQDLQAHALITNPADGRDLVSRLRSDIVEAEFSPGARLKFAVLAKRYGAGHGTLREALSQLVSEGFVTQEINKGFAVAPVSRDELFEITEHYIDLEQRALIGAIKKGNDAWEVQIVAAHHSLYAIEKHSWEERVARHAEWVQRHRDFHTSLVAACGGPWLLRLRALMFDQLDRYRFLTKMAVGKSGTSRRDEHRNLMDAVLSRDAPLASDLLDQHIRKTTEMAAKLLSMQD